MSRYFSAFLFVFLFVSVSSTVSFAQSASEIEFAKQLARQRGYSESQINEMVRKQQGGGTSGPIISNTPSVDRNAIVEMEQRQAYGVAGDGFVSMPAMDEDTTSQSAVYGHSIFRSRNLNFVPSYNIPTPANYKLSAGDEIVIDIWGAVVANISAVVSPDGSINIPDLGPVYIYGQTVAQAEKNLKGYLSKIYSGLNDESPDTYMKLSLGRIKSVTVNVLGDVAKPGSYTLPSLSSIASALYLAGGPTDLGTVRDIRLYRNNKLVSSLDVYDYIMTGNFGGNVRLEDNDVVIVGPYNSHVVVEGAVKRPMSYELKSGETLKELLEYSGGFAKDAYTGAVQVNRQKMDGAVEGPVSRTFNVDAHNFSQFKLMDGDTVSVRSNDMRFANKVTITGPVWRPGTYSIDDTLTNLKQLLVAAGGLREDAYLDKAYIARLGKERNKEQVSFSLKNVILGAENILLMPDDEINIFTVGELKPYQSITVGGEVNSPGEFEYREGMTLGDVILMAQGMTNAATLEKVDIARRIDVKSQPESVRHLSDTVAILMSFNLLKNPSHADTKLQPFDMVFIRKSVYYKPQEGITITGQVNYPGTYVVEKNTVRLSDIVKKAEGFNRDAYVPGAKLTRVLTIEEQQRLEVAMDIAKKHAEDSTTFDQMNVGDRFTIAIDLVAAMAAPGSDADIVLRAGDIISVPKYNNTVKISGGVLYPNTVSFKKSMGYKQYINGAGGYLKEAVKGKVYMVHMNGSVAAKGSREFKVQPGTEIIVPMRGKRDPMTATAIMSLATSATSLAAMVATIVNITK